MGDFWLVFVLEGVLRDVMHPMHHTNGSLSEWGDCAGLFTYIPRHLFGCESFAERLVVH